MHPLRAMAVTVAAIVALSSVAYSQPSEATQGQSGPGPAMPVSTSGTETLSPEASAVAPAPQPVSLEEPINSDAYICGPGDGFEINFWGQQNFRVRITADLEGKLFISKVGYVSVAGKTLTDVRGQVRKKVRGTYPGLNFELSLVAPRTFLVHVVDDIKIPGAYAAQALERVSAVLNRAGGSTGSRRQIKIQRKSGVTLSADLVRYEQTGDTTYNPYVLDGDIIRVPAADVRVTVAGAVKHPGTYELVGDKDIAELTELAGGFTSSVTNALPIQITRRNKQEKLAIVELKLGAPDTPKFKLIDEDIVQFRSADELQRSVMIIGAVVGAEDVDPATTAKRLPFVEGDTVLSLLTRAGGIKAPGDLHRSYISRPKPDQSVEIIPLDLEALLIRRDFSADKKVSMGDTIVVPAMQYSVMVEGAVSRAGIYPYNPLFGISQYIAHAGGRTRTAQSLSDVHVVDTHGKTHSFSDSFRLSPGDAIVVPERNFTRAEVVQLVIAGASLLLSGITVAYVVSH